MEGETGTVDSFETVASGDIVIWGVDTDDDYTMKETTPPEGYNELKDTVAVEVNAGNDSQIKVENKSGTELPSTGGIGTTIFYVVGGILLLGAAIVLVARRKANN
jgi:LPXTG-motif cell wall-anchored protein